MRVSQACRLQLKREFLLGLRQRNEWLHPLAFFVIVVSLFPVAVGPEARLLREMAPGVLWVSALFSMLLSLDSVFKDDHQNGCLAQMLLSPVHLTARVSCKLLVHWLLSGLPLVMLSPMLAVGLQLPGHSLGVLVISLTLGTLVLSLLGGMMVALTVGLRQGGVLLALLLLPLAVPVLIFGSQAVQAAALGLPASGALLMLAALLVLAATVTPLATVAALRIGVVE